MFYGTKNISTNIIKILQLMQNIINKNTNINKIC